MQQSQKNLSTYLAGFESQYVKCLHEILHNGYITENRTGIDTKVIQHAYFYLENIGHNFPIIKAKKVFPYMALTELLWFLQGRTDVEWLNQHNVHYWDNWCNSDGTIGKSYGHQFRNFNGIDQLQKNVLDVLETNPLSRKIILSLWNVSDLKDMTLEPCVHQYQFSCQKIRETYYEVSLHVTQRSADTFLGLPYDFMISGWFLNIICEYLLFKTGIYYQAKDIHYTTNDTHIYTNHLNQVNQYLSNFKENKNDVISGQTVLEFKYENQITFNSIIPNTELTIDKFIQPIISSWNGKIYENIKIHKVDWVDTYPQIKAEVAI